MSTYKRAVTVELEFHEDRQEQPDGSLLVTTTLLLPGAEQKLIVCYSVSAEARQSGHPADPERIQKESVQSIVRQLESASKGIPLVSEKTEIAQLAEEHGKIVAKWIHDVGLTGVVEFLAIEALVNGVDPAKIFETLEKISEQKKADGGA